MGEETPSQLLIAIPNIRKSADFVRDSNFSGPVNLISLAGVFYLLVTGTSLSCLVLSAIKTLSVLRGRNSYTHLYLPERNVNYKYITGL